MSWWSTISSLPLFCWRGSPIFWVSFIIAKENLERAVFCYFFPKLKLVHCKEGCLKISVINKPRSYNFLESGTLHLLPKAAQGYAIFLSIDYSYFTTIFYVLQSFWKWQNQIQEVNLYHQLSLLGNGCISACLSGKKCVSVGRRAGGDYLNTRLGIYSSNSAHTIALRVTKSKQQNIICSNLTNRDRKQKRIRRPLPVNIHTGSLITMITAINWLKAFGLRNIFNTTTVVYSTEFWNEPFSFPTATIFYSCSKATSFCEIILKTWAYTDFSLL